MYPQAYQVSIMQHFFYMQQKVKKDWFTKADTNSSKLWKKN